SQQPPRAHAEGGSDRTGALAPVPPSRRRGTPRRPDGARVLRVELGEDGVAHVGGQDEAKQPAREPDQERSPWRGSRRPRHNRSRSAADSSTARVPAAVIAKNRRARASRSGPAGAATE